FSSFGKGCKNKEIPEWILSLPKKELGCFLSGLLEGDGSEGENSNKITLANPKMILSTYLIGLKLGKEMSLQMQEKSGKLSSTKYVYTILFRNYYGSRSRNTASAGIKFHDG